MSMLIGILVGILLLAIGAAGLFLPERIVPFLKTYQWWYRAQDAAAQERLPKPTFAGHRSFPLADPKKYSWQTFRRQAQMIGGAFTLIGLLVCIAAMRS